MNSLTTLKNLPTEKPQRMESMLDPKANQVVSMAISKSDNVHMTLFTFADGEMVSEEKYLGDSLYYLIEGETNIKFEDRTISLKEGEIFAVPAMVQHAIGGGGAFKVMQITILDK